MGISIDELVFDPSNPDEGHNTGAYLRGSDGTVIGNSGDALKTTLSDGTDDLDINADGSLNAVVSATDLDIRDLSASSDSVAISDGTDQLEINADGSLNSVVTATDLDIRDLSAATDSVSISDGTDTLAINADGSINVVTNDLDIRDLSLALDKVNVVEHYNSVQFTAASATDVASEILASPLANRKAVTIQNLGNRDVYLGGASVTTATGVKVPAGASADYKWDDAVDIYAITAAGTADLRMIEHAYS